MAAAILFPVVVAGGWLAWKRWASPTAPAAAATAAVRTHRVSGGGVQTTLRLTGTTRAERFALLTAPQLRGSRSGYGRGGPSGSFSRSSSSTTITSNAGRSSTSGSSTSGALASMTGGGGGGGGSRSSNALQAATSRVRSSGSSSRVRGYSIEGGAAMGGGLGSTGDALPGGSSGPPAVGSSSGRGSRGGGEFMLVLQDVIAPGKMVAKGETVAEFDRQYMELRLDDYRASVQQTKASFRTMKANLEVSRNAHEQMVATAKAELDKARLDMRTLPVRSEMDSERLRLAVEETEARYKQLLNEVPLVKTSQAAEERNAEIELQQSEIELKRAEANVNRMILKAPVAGMVVMENTFRGSEFDQIKQGDQLYPGQPFMRIVDPTSMVVSAKANQVDIDALRIGQKAIVRFDAFPGLELPAHVYSIASVGQASRYRADWIKEIPVMLKLDRLDPRVIPDLSVSCDVILQEEQQAAVIPLESVSYDEAGGQPFVYVRDGKDWKRRPVQLGLANYVQVAVRSGLKPGETIALERPPGVGQKR